MKNYFIKTLLSISAVILFSIVVYAAGTYSSYYEISHSITSQTISPVGSGTIYYDYDIKWWNNNTSQYTTISSGDIQVDAAVRIQWRKQGSLGLWFNEGTEKSTPTLGTNGKSGTLSWSSMPSGTYRFTATKTMQNSLYWVKDVFKVRYP